MLVFSVFVNGKVCFYGDHGPMKTHTQLIDGGSQNCAHVGPNDRHPEIVVVTKTEMTWKNYLFFNGQTKNLYGVDRSYSNIHFSFKTHFILCFITY